MRVFETYKGKIYKFYGKGSDLSAVQSNDTIIMQVSFVVLYELLVCLIQDFSAFYCFYSYTVLVTVHIITCSFNVHISPSKTIANLKIFQLNSENAIWVEKLHT